MSNILIIGAGAVGQYLAGQLSASGQSVALIEKSAEKARYLNHNKIVVKHADKEYISSGIKAYCCFADIPVKDAEFDYIFLCVKAYHLKDVLDEIITFIGKAVIVVFQNGIGNEELVSEYIMASNLISATTTTAIYINKDNAIVTSGKGGIGIAPMSRETNAEELYRIFHDCGFTVIKYDNYKSLKWSKLIINMIGNASVAILDMPSARVFDNDAAVKLEIAALKEAAAVMKKQRIAPVNLPGFPVYWFMALFSMAPFSLLKSFLKGKVAAGRGDKKPSLHMELLAENVKTENEYINGAVYNEAVKLGISAPANKTLYEILDDITANNNWDAYSGKPENLWEKYLKNKSG